jgi:hypothetical protein
MGCVRDNETEISVLPEFEEGQPPSKRAKRALTDTWATAYPGAVAEKVYCPSLVPNPHGIPHTRVSLRVLAPKASPNSEPTGWDRPPKATSVTRMDAMRAPLALSRAAVIASTGSR